LAEKPSPLRPGATSKREPSLALRRQHDRRLIAKFCREPYPSPGMTRHRSLKSADDSSSRRVMSIHTPATVSLRKRVRRGSFAARPDGLMSQQGSRDSQCCRGLKRSCWSIRQRYGPLAQRKSTSLTWKGSEVRSLYRAPAFAHEQNEGCHAVALAEADSRATRATAR
jgi:hypothetical protein